MIKLHPDINLHLHSRPEERQSELWLESVGHYASEIHYLAGRVTDGMVINYCIDGEGEYWVGNRRYLIQPGDIYFAPGNIRHRYGCNPGVGWEIYWLHFNGELGKRLAAQAGFSLTRWHFNVGIHSRLIDLFEEMMDTVRTRDIYSGLRTASQLFTLLTEIRIHTHTGGPQYRELDAALAGAPDSVEQMAAAVHLSKCHFVRKFRKTTGITPWRLIIQRRVSEAKELLTSTELSIKEIATQIGVLDANYFSRLFRKEAGLSATEYRKLHKQA